MSGVGPKSSTAGLAGNVPKESTQEQSEMGSSDVPGSFPETPGIEASEFSVNPIPATSGIGNPVKLEPGEKVPDPSTLTSNTISSTVQDDTSLKKSAEDSQQTFGVAPIPASSGIGNPVHTNPGEKIPGSATFNPNTINSTVRTDKASYENSSGAPQLPDVVTPQKEREARGGGLFDVPGISSTMIPESSLPMGEGTLPEKDPGFAIQSVGPQSSTAALAADVPLEPRGVPEVVKESQAEAGVDPEASGDREAVREKTEMEKELESKVPEEPPTAEGTSTGRDENLDTKASSGGVLGGIAAGGAAVGGAIAAAAGYASHKMSAEPTTSLPSRGLPTSIQQSIDEMNRGTSIAPPVPDTVQESIAKAHFAPEAAGNKEAVAEKSAVEPELLKRVPTENESGKAAPYLSGMGSSSHATMGSPIAPEVPDVVQESIAKSHVAPEAAGNEEAVIEKGAMESELLRRVPTANETGESAPYPSAMMASAGATTGSPIAPEVPDVVQESIAKSHVSPEAAANEEAVVEKGAMESELLKRVPTAHETGESAPHSSTMMASSGAATGTAIAPEVPDVVQESIANSYVSPEAAGNEEAVIEKGAVESELMKKISPSDTIGEPAPSSSAALAATAPAPTFPDNTPVEAALAQKSQAPTTSDKSLTSPTTAPATNPNMLAAPASAPAKIPAQTSMASAQTKNRADSRDISPMTRSGGTQTEAQTQPSVTTGVASSTTPKISEPAATTSTTPQKELPKSLASQGSVTASASSGGKEEKKHKRASGFFGKLKAKFGDKH